MPSPTPHPAPPPGRKVRFRFAKTGDLRLVSHHHLIRAAERLLRRADLPVRNTGGVHPQPRIVFALSLPLGVAGCHEVVEIEFESGRAGGVSPLSDTPQSQTEPETEPQTGGLHPPLAEILDRLRAQSPHGLEFLSAKEVPANLNAVPRRAVYRFPVPAARIAETQLAIASLMAEDKVWVDKTHPKPRRVNVRPYLRSLSIDDAGFLVLDAWVTGQGSVRAEDLIAKLGLADVLADGSVLERIELELIDEAPADAPDAPPTGPPETAPWNHAPVPTAADDDPASAVGTWGLSPAGPEVE